MSQLKERMMTQQINQTIAYPIGSATIEKDTKQKRKSHDTQSVVTLKMSVIQNFQPPLYSKINSQPKLKIFFFQMIGMFVFLYGIGSIDGLLFFDLYVILSLLMGIIFSVTVSGGNLNPAITLSNALKTQTRYKFNLLPYYYAAQFIGGCLGFILAMLLNDTVIVPFIVKQPTFYKCFHVIAAQTIGTFILIFFILQISNPNTTFIDNQFSGYMFIILFIHIGRKYAPTSYCVINFMIVLISAIIPAVHSHNFEGFKYCILWLAGDYFGTCLAYLFYEKVFYPNVKHMRTLKRQQQNQQVQSFMQTHMGQQT